MTNVGNDFVSPSDPVLLKISKPIATGELFTQDIKRDIEKMLKVAYGEQADRSKPVLVGLAAPQIGISKRIILVDIGADGRGGVSDLRVFINPIITWKSEQKTEWYEGCFSTDRVCGLVRRPNQVKVKYLDQLGKAHEEIYSGYVARIFQHEIDHLDGKEFVSHIQNPDDLHWVEDEEFPLYRDKEAWRTWQKKCSFAKWQEIKSGKSK